MRKKIIILTGNEIRHRYFKIKLSCDPRFKVIRTFCEGDEKSLEKRTFSNRNSSNLEKYHVQSRTQSELDFFLEYILQTKDNSRSKLIKKGEINDQKIVKKINDLKPDLIVCFGSSLIKSNLIDKFENRFLNVHLGLSPYYRGSGTNIWPLINKELNFIGATFMKIDKGIDTGQIIHQIKPKIYLGDNPHTIGNRLIKDMSVCFADIVANHEYLSSEPQHDKKIKGKLYLQKDFDHKSCRKLYDNINSDMIKKYLSYEKKYKFPKLIINKGLIDKIK